MEHPQQQIRNGGKQQGRKSRVLWFYRGKLTLQMIVERWSLNMAAGELCVLLNHACQALHTTDAQDLARQDTLWGRTRHSWLMTNVAPHWVAFLSSHPFLYITPSPLTYVVYRIKLLYIVIYCIILLLVIICCYTDQSGISTQNPWSYCITPCATERRPQKIVMMRFALASIRSDCSLRAASNSVAKKAT